MAKEKKKSSEVEELGNAPTKSGDAEEAEGLKPSNIPVIAASMKRLEHVPEEEYRLIQVNIKKSVKINGDVLEGTVVMPMHLYRSVKHMIEKMVRAKESVTIGKKYTTFFSADGSRHHVEAD